MFLCVLPLVNLKRPLFRICSFFLAAILLITANACKKGENDPFLSLSSRKARVHGEWNLGSYEYTEKSVSVSGDYFEITEVLDDGSILRIEEEYIDMEGNTLVDTIIIYIDQASYSFDKNGTWSRTFNTREVSSVVWQENEINYTIESTKTKKLTETGDWSFVDGLKDQYANKERMLMNKLATNESLQITSVTTDDQGSQPTYTNGNTIVNAYQYATGQVSNIVVIDRLARKEMVLKNDRIDTGSLSITPYQGVQTTYPMDSFYSESTISLNIVP